MIYPDIVEFAGVLRPNRAICGLDLGDKTIGVAISDLRRLVATPVTVIRRVKFTVDAAALLDLLAKRGVQGIVLGLPLNMDGSAGPRVQTTQAFARNLMKLTDMPITFWDERLSTVAAERALLEADTSRKRRAEVIDQVAAGYILQGALDRMDALARQKAADLEPGEDA
jgi:putative Holliday junction resolvase